MSEDAGTGGVGIAGYTLVVGPTGEDRDWIENTLLQGGFEVAVASEGDVLVVPDLVPPKLVVVDDSGHSSDARLATMKRLSHHPGLIGVPIVMVAYDADIDSFSNAITKGAAAYLVKPVGSDELVAVTQRLTGWTGHTDRTEKRRRLRRPLIMKVDVDVRSRKQRMSAQIVDVSGTGCRIEVPEQVPAGEMIRVILHGHEASTHVALGAEVRWYRRTPEGVHLIGAKFTGTTALLAGKLLGFVSSGMT